VGEESITRKTEEFRGVSKDSKRTGFFVGKLGRRTEKFGEYCVIQKGIREITIKRGGTWEAIDEAKV